MPLAIRVPKPPTLWLSFACVMALMLGAPQPAEAQQRTYPAELDPDIAAVFESPNGQAVMGQIPAATGDDWQRLLDTSSYQTFNADLVRAASASGDDPAATPLTYTGPVPTDPQCVEALQELAQVLAEAAAAGVWPPSWLTRLKIAIAVWKVKRYCYPWRTDDPPADGDPDPGDPPLPEAPNIKPPADDDSDRDCKARWDIVVRQRASAVLLSIDYGDGTGDSRWVPAGTGSVTLSLSHQYPHPAAYSAAIEVLRVTDTTTGGKAHALFMHWGATGSDPDMDTTH